MDVDGSAGLAGGEEGEAKGRRQKKEEPKKKGGLLGKFTTSSQQAEAVEQQTVASAGARGGFPDRDAKGGANKCRSP